MQESVLHQYTTPHDIEDVEVCREKTQRHDVAASESKYIPSVGVGYDLDGYESPQRVFEFIGGGDESNV